MRSIVVLGMNYGPDSDPLRDRSAKRDRGAISVYAQNRDYHDVIKGKLKEIAGKIAARGGGDVKVFVDTAPVMEKPLAEAAGLGWQGKHTNLVSREFGSWLFLGTIFTTAELDAGCSRRTTIAAPAAPASTSARPMPFPRPTGSMRGAASPISPSRTRGRSRTNSARRSATASMAATTASPSARGTSSPRPPPRRSSPRATICSEPPLAELLALDDAGFRAFFSGSPVKRIGRDRFVRNVLIAAGNSGDASLVGTVPRAARRRLAAGARRGGVGAVAAAAQAAEFAGGADRCAERQKATRMCGE